MKLLLDVYNPGEYPGFEAAFLDLDPALAKTMLVRREAFNRVMADDPGLTEIQYWGSDPIYLSSIPQTLDGDAVDMEGRDFVALPDTCAPEDFENFAERTECDRMVINRDCIYWDCFPKHADRHIETRPIDWKTIEQAAKEVA